MRELEVSAQWVRQPGLTGSRQQWVGPDGAFGTVAAMHAREQSGECVSYVLKHHLPSCFDHVCVRCPAASAPARRLGGHRAAPYRPKIPQIHVAMLRL